MRHIGKCLRCGKETEYKFACRVRDYCSYSCSNTVKMERKSALAERTTFSCLQCVQAFTLLASVARARGSVKFCSTKCSGMASVKPSSMRSKYREKRIRIFPCTPWSSVNPDLDARRAYFRAYVQKNKEKIYASTRASAKANRVHRKYLQHMRRAAGRLTRDQWQALIQQGKSCSHCGATERLEVDHITPVALGGKTEDGNLQILCRRCNASKGISHAPKSVRLSS